MTEITSVHIVIIVIVSLLMVAGYLLYIRSSSRAVNKYNVEQATALNSVGQDGATEHHREVVIK